MTRKTTVVIYGYDKRDFGFDKKGMGGYNKKDYARTKLYIYFLLYINMIFKMSINMFLLELEGTQSEGFE